jgi:cytochrome c-type protein NapB
MDHSPSPAPPPPGKLATVALAIVIGLALVGFVVGTRPSPDHARPPRTAVDRAGPPGQPGQTYAELRDRRFRMATTPVADWASLAAALPGWPEPIPPTQAQRAAAVAARATRRAFDGAPPVVPHVIDERSVAACLDCHQDGVAVGERLAPRMSHHPLMSCTQCHVPGVRRPHDTGALPESTFAGRPSAGQGSRAWVGAPPTIPHPTFMREQCASCHGPGGLAGLRTPHPQRGSCEQCHVSAAELNPSGGPP